MPNKKAEQEFKKHFPVELKILEILEKENCTAARAHLILRNVRSFVNKSATVQSARLIEEL